MDCSDEQLARAVAAGNEAAFEAIYDRYAPGLLAFCHQLLGSRDEAEDAVQQSFARAYQALRSGPGPDCLKHWLYAIARNRCLTLLATRRVVIDLDDVGGAVPPVEDCYAEVQRRADVGDLVDDLRRLPDDQRVALVLFELGGHSQHDIGEVLGVAPVRVKALVFQAREGLARAREARAGTCREVLEELAVLRGPAPHRGPLADHLARCAACSAFAAEVGRQRRALSVIMLPAVPSLALKAKVLGTALTGGGGVAAVGGAGGTGGAAVIVAAASGGAAAGGGALAVAGAGGAATLGAAATGTAGLAAAGGLATVGAGGVAAGLAAKGVVAKILTAVAVAGSATAVTVAPGTRPTGPVAPASIAPIVADRPAPRPAGPADAPHVGTLPSSAPGPADQPPTPAPVVPPVPAVTAPAQAPMAAPPPASTPAPAPDPAPPPAVSTAPDPGGAQAAPADPAPADPAPADTGGAEPAPAASNAPADSGGAEPVDPTTTDATAAGGVRPAAAAQ